MQRVDTLEVNVTLRQTADPSVCLAAAVIGNVVTLRKTQPLSFSVFPMFVPSLSWQKDRF
jgi:hypothetical protein